MEFHVAGGIICIHTHIYTDKVKRSDELEAQTREFFNELHKRLKTEGKSIMTEHWGKTKV